MAEAYGKPYLERPLTVLPGVGKVRAALFSKLGIETIEDLLYHFPRGYQNRGAVNLLIEAAMLPVSCATILTVGSAPTSVRLRGNKIMTRFTAFDESGKCVITFFNQPFVRDIFEVGSTFRFWGAVEKTGRNFAMSCPEYELYFAGTPLPDFKSVYPLTQGLNQKAISAAVRAALESADELPDPIPAEARAAYALMGFKEALTSIHFPKNYAEMDEARRRFVFEELFLFSLGMQSSEKKTALRETQRFKSVDLSPYLGLLPFSLTNAQQRTVADLLKDMTSDYPMTRLICGDVGSGKTACAAAAVYIALKNGRQAALMAPTEILASQHFALLAPLFEKLGFKTSLLIGSMTASQKRAAREKLRSGETDFAIGTHALLTSDTEFARLGLVIADEQHRFGVNQRSGLSGKGKEVHTLVMTATPIPRTLALILYSGLDISYIDELPPGRQKVRTYAVDRTYEPRLRAFIAKQASEGHQTYVVCPAVEQEEDPENGRLLPLSFDPLKDNAAPIPLKAAVQYAKELQDALPELSVGFVHGRMKAKEKEEVMTAFSKNELQVLVSTTVIEVGVDVPNATLMIVENAERFGLSQLHQLRGRVGRGKAQSYCILVSDCPDDSPAGQRLKTICKTDKGFEIANEDLKMRGPGDFFPSSEGGPTRQSGEFSFRLASLCTDASMPEKAAMAAKSLIENDPDLKDHPASNARMRKLFALAKNTMN